jgi:hypothetical protein
VSAEKHSLVSTTATRAKSSALETQELNEASTSNHSQSAESNSLTKLDEMASARLTGSREGMVFDDNYQGMILKIYTL